ncbi:hypothetical protein PCASD_23258 [Puccinia coronata f. sp. avenae]|uniref:Uncharacterized protein n=1 Tax=Puccinia coronata f. sp. avenae TaxID=200324 RepID=A0A2N5S4P5_9BASI|nr:hypothetical protein PCASD_23258 [Puccinia coronata f. sp. avenae]
MKGNNWLSWIRGSRRRDTIIFILNQVSLIPPTRGPDATEGKTATVKIILASVEHHRAHNSSRRSVLSTVRGACQPGFRSQNLLSMELPPLTFALVASHFCNHKPVDQTLHVSVAIETSKGNTETASSHRQASDVYLRCVEYNYCTLSLI